MSNLVTDKPVDKGRQIKIYIDAEVYSVDVHEMTGAELKALAGIPSGDRLYKEVPGSRPDKAITDQEVVRLHEWDKFYGLPPGTKGEGVLPLVEKQIDHARRDHPDLTATSLADGSIELEIASYELPQGWNKTHTRVLMVVPPGYPDQRPQGFFADHDLLLASRQRGGGQGDEARNGSNWSRFCWGSDKWDPQRDGLWKYVKLMLSRFEDPS